ncbi:MAG: adenosine deaminase [Victivallaceae bacterium]|nr:adenosine deaminase [Victivallaceae bacterium]
MEKSQNQSWFDRIPKVELHLHLEGAIPYPALFKIISRNEGNESFPDLNTLKNKFRKYRNFPHFLEIWRWKNKFLQKYEDFTLISQAVAENLARQNILYAEIFFSPSDFAVNGLKPRELAIAIRKGLAKVPEIEIALVVDFVRSCGQENAARILEEIKDLQSLGIIGVGIGGAEKEFPPEMFTNTYKQARKLGFHTSAHAGEAVGAKSIWGAINNLGVDRIGHGIRAEEDSALIEHLAKHRIPLEMCPISNLRTKVVCTPEEHPVRRYFERGLMVTVNTDDPMMFGNSLADEYRLLEERLGFSKKEICGLIMNAVNSSWLPQEKKCSLIKSIQTTTSWKEVFGQISLS